MLLGNYHRQEATLVHNEKLERFDHQHFFGKIKTILIFIRNQ